MDCSNIDLSVRDHPYLYIAEVYLYFNPEVYQCSARGECVEGVTLVQGSSIV